MNHIVELGHVGLHVNDLSRMRDFSWRASTVAGLQELHSKLLAENTEITAVITQGNALAVYFLDPERNRCEVYVHTGLAVPQPFRRSISLAGDPQTILAENERIATASRQQHG